MQNLEFQVCNSPTTHSSTLKGYIYEVTSCIQVELGKIVWSRCYLIWEVESLERGTLNYCWGEGVSMYYTDLYKVEETEISSKIEGLEN